MKRIVCILLIFAMLSACCLMTSCSFINKLLGKDETPDDGTIENPDDGGEDPDGGDEDGDGGDVIPNPPIPESDQLNITESGYTFFCASADAGVQESFSNLIYRIAKATGKQPTVAQGESEANVIFGVADYSSLGAGSVVGRYEIAIKDGKLYITAGNTESLNIAKDRLLTYNTDKGIVISKSMNESYMFNIYDYRSGKTTVYTEADLANLNLLSEVKIDGITMTGFNPMKIFYSLKSTADTYPMISATAVNQSASISVDQASADNGATAKVTVTVNNLKRVYSFGFYSETLSSVNSAIVHKNGAKGTISFVIDDGTESTANFMYNSIFNKEGYENITATFALKTNKLVTMHTTTDENGNTVYAIDENGNYLYTEIAGKFDYWRNILATGKADIASHTHTHVYEGDNDSGGIFVYKKNDGTYAQTADLPAGHITMELVGSNQVIKAVKGTDDSIAFIIPGVGASHMGAYSSIYMDCGEYLVSRGTFGAGTVVTDYNSRIYLPEELANSSLKSLAAYMIEHYTTDPAGSTDANSTNAECLAAGIQNWTDFMDTAISTGGWASFCIHEIRPDNYTGGDHHIYESQAKQLFAYANAYGDDAWIASYNDAAKYYVEWSKSTVSSKIYDNSTIAVALETDLTDARYDMALTVRVEIPESWAGAKLDGASLEILSDEQGRYVYVDLLPGESINITVDGYTSVPDSGVALG